MVTDLRAAISALLARSNLADRAGMSFGGKRDFYSALGYQEVLQPTDYWGAYKRWGIMKRIVETYPLSTWRGGGELVEDEDPNTETEFESAFNEMNQRLKVWPKFAALDVLAGLGHYAVLFIGAGGTDWSAPLERVAGPQDIKYLTPYSERDAPIESLVTDRQDERFGQPLYYTLNRLVSTLGTRKERVETLAQRVHWTRVLPVAEGAFDDSLNGTPRLEAVWNYNDDLVKVVGGGAEAFFKRADSGKQFKLDPTITVSDAEKTAMKEQIEDYTHDLKRVLTTRGVDIQDLGSAVADFSRQADTVVGLISATTGIPQRILMGSERGELASSQDQSNFDDRVEDRRHGFAEPYFVRPFVDRMVAIGALPKPAQYETRWPEIMNLTMAQRLGLAEAAARVNAAMGMTVITEDEIRDLFLDLPPLGMLDATNVRVAKMGKATRLARLRGLRALKARLAMLEAA